MWIRSHIVEVLLIAVLLAACNPAPEYRSPVSSPPVLPNILVESQGNIEVRRQASTRFFPVGFGAQLQSGDILRVTEGTAAVFCGDESLWDKGPNLLTSGEHGVPCVTGRPPRLAPDLSRLRNKSEDQSDVSLNVLSPRSGMVLNDRPTLRWRTLPDIQVYTVTLDSTDGRDRPAITATGGEIIYPASWSPLRMGGADYELHVEGGGQNYESLGFSLLSPQQAVRVRDQVAHLRQRPLTESAVALLVAKLYLSYDLRSEAVEILTSVSSSEQIAAIQLALGETYLDMGLFAESEAAFRRAVTLAQEGNFLEGEATAHRGLGLAMCGQTLRVSPTDAQLEKARDQLIQAETQYKILEMTMEVDEIGKWLKNISAICTPKQQD